MTSACPLTLDEERRGLLVSCVRLSELSQKELAAKAKLEQAWLSRMLSGNRKRLNSKKVKQFVALLADVLDEKGPEVSSRAAVLREVFLENLPTTKSLDAIKSVAVVGLVSCGLGIEEAHAEQVWYDPHVKARIEGAIQVLCATEAIVVAIPDCLNNLATQERIISGVMNCGLPVSREAVCGLLADVEAGTARSINALKGVIMVVDISRKE